MCIWADYHFEIIFLATIFDVFQTQRMALEATFKETAESFSKEINQTLTNDDLKEVYGLYKQVKSKEQHSAMFHSYFIPSCTLSIPMGSPIKTSCIKYPSQPIHFMPNQEGSILLSSRGRRETATRQGRACSIWRGRPSGTAGTPRRGWPSELVKT